MQTDPWSAAFAELADEHLPTLAARERELWLELTSPWTDGLVVVGAGSLGQKVAAGLRQVGRKPLAFTDNNASLWGTNIEGIPVLAPQEAARRFGERAAFVVAIWPGGFGDRMSIVCEQLRALACQCVLTFAPLFWWRPDLFLPHWRCSLPSRLASESAAIRQGYSLWEDEESRRVYVTQLAWLCGKPLAYNSPPGAGPYFDDDAIQLGTSEFFIDCGAFDGDTLAAFLEKTERFERVYVIEPDRQNLAKLNQLISRLPPHRQDRIVVHPFALGTRSCTVRFAEGQGLLSKVAAQGGVEVECRTLDELLCDSQPTFIKMDIEGAEPDALEGARQVISRDRPKLAICVYHEPQHLWRIPLLMKSLCPGYVLKLRHYLETCDVVCYARASQ